MAEVIRLVDIVKSYIMGDSVVHALDHVNVQIGEGEFTSIMGPSGSGKSTMMNILGCLDRPTSGHYFLRGRDIAGYNDDELAHTRNAEIGFVFQNFNLIPRANALKNVTLPLMYSEHRPKNAKEIGMQMLELVGMADRATHRPNELSGGQKQRIAIARAMINDPSIILADEPTGALDSQTGHMIMDIFHKLHEEQGKTVVLITHSKELAAETERIVTLNDGMIVSDSRKTEKGCDLSGHHKMNDGCNKPEIGEEGMIC